MTRVTTAIGMLTQKIDDHGNTLNAHVPTPDQRRCRLYTVLQSPNRSGRSRHGHPARTRWNTPLITVR